MQRSCTELELIGPKRDRPVRVQQCRGAQGQVCGPRLGGGPRARCGSVRAGPQVSRAQPPGAQGCLNRGPWLGAVDQQGALQVAAAAGEDQVVVMKAVVLAVQGDGTVEGCGVRPGKPDQQLKLLQIRPGCRETGLQDTKVKSAGQEALTTQARRPGALEQGEVIG